MAERSKKPKKSYSNSFQTLNAVWEVLRRYSSREHPLTVAEINQYLQQLENPSAFTVERRFPAERELMELLFPGKVVEAGKPAVVNTYRDGKTIHIVLETPEGHVLARERGTVRGEVPPFKAPSYSTLYKMLKDGIPFELDTFPYRLTCVEPPEDLSVPEKAAARKRRDEEIDWNAGEKGNQPRKYYLASVLTDAEWHIFADLIQVYPFISHNQKEKFLETLSRLRLGKQSEWSSRYVFERESDSLFRIIAILDEAIRNRQKVELTYGEYRLEQHKGKWTPVLSPRKKRSVLKVSPYALMWSNGNYYLVGRSRSIMMNLRVDRILAAAPLEETFELPPDFDPVEYRNRSPVMYTGKFVPVRMICKTSLLSVLLDFFGELPQYAAPRSDGTVEVTMQIAPAGVKLFAMQYAGSVEVLEPENLRQEIAGELEAALQTYRG